MVHPLLAGMLLHKPCAAWVCPIPEMSSLSPSTVIRAHVLMAAGLTALPPMHESAIGQGMLDEYLVNRLQIELGRQVHDRQIFVVEFFLLAGFRLVALDQMPIELPMGIHMPVEVHRHETGELHEARIDIPLIAGCMKGTGTMALRLNQSTPRSIA